MISGVVMYEIFQQQVQDRVSKDRVEGSYEHIL